MGSCVDKEMEIVVGFLYELLLILFLRVWIGVEKGVIVVLVWIILIYSSENVENSNIVE